MSQSMFNLIKAAVGFGTVLLPLNMKRSGLIPGIGLILFASYLSMFSLHLLAKASIHTNTGDYFRLGSSFGAIGEMIAIVTVVIQKSGGIIGYIYFSGAYIGNAIAFFTPIPFNEEKFRLIITFGTTVLFMFPLSCLKDMRTLGKTSILGLICIGYIVCLTIADYFVDEEPRGEINIYPKAFHLDFFTAFNSILFAYSNHFTLVSLTKVIQRPTTGRIRFLIGGSGLASTSIYLIMGLFGYFHFGNAISSEILSAKQPMTLPYAIGKLALGLVLVFSAPLLVEPTRASLEKLFDRTGEKTAPSRHYIITAGFIGTCLLIALVAGKEGLTVLEVFTSLGGPLLSFVYPALYFVKLSKGRYSINALEWIMIIVLILVGLTSCALGTFNSSNQLFMYFKSRFDEF